MAREVTTRDNGDGSATTFYDDGSSQTWNITTGAATGMSTPPTVYASSPSMSPTGMPGIGGLSPEQMAGWTQATNDNLNAAYNSDWYQKYVYAPQEREAANQQTERDRANTNTLAGLKNQAAQIAISQGTAKAQQWYQQQLAKNASDRLAFDRENAAARLQLDTQNAQADQAIRWGGVGMQGLSLLGSLRGPENYAQAANVARGMAGMPNTLMALQNLQNGTGLPLFSAPSGVAAPVTLGSLASMATTGQPGSTPATNLGAGGVSQAGSPGLAASTASLGLGASSLGMVPTVGGMSNNPDDIAAYKIAQAGPGALKLGSLESLFPSEQSMLGSRLSNVGTYLPDFMAGYMRAGVHQANPMSA